MDYQASLFGRRDDSITYPADNSHGYRSNQYTNAQDRHSLSGPAGNHNSTQTGYANSLRTMLSGSSTRSNIPSPTSFALASTTANTASTSRTSFGSSSSGYPMAFGDNRQETDVATASTQPDDATTKTAMCCVCCWKPKQELTKHYPRCPYIKGDWAFWACPYTLEVFRNQEAFINHIKSYKSDEKRIAVTESIYVTARDWAMDFSEAAKTRQLVNTIFHYFNANPRLAEEWKALHSGELLPDLNNVGDVGEILKQSSILRRRSPTEEVSIGNLRQVFRAGGKASVKIQTRPDVAPWNSSASNDCYHDDNMNLDF